MRKEGLLTILIVLSFIQAGYAQQPALQGYLKELFAGPSDPSGRGAADPSVRSSWLDSMKTWRTNERSRLNYNGAEYLRPEFGWLKHTFIYTLMMAQERSFYDPVAKKYTVDRYLDDCKKRYGGLDAVYIWPTYPNIGIDNRNQFDLLADMPGGIAGVKKMVADFKKRGVRVFFPIMIWDHGTRPFDGSMPVALIKEMKTIGADGLNGDTMGGVTENFLTACDSLVYPVALQPEWAINDLKMIGWNTTSWGYYWSGSGMGADSYPFVPGVSVYKWLEPRHQVFVSNRWIIDRTDDLQYAFFNGVGYNTWENIWGIWNQVSERNAAAIRRIAAIYRRFPGLWNSPEWEPHIPAVQKGVFVSRFSGVGKTVYTLVNRDSTDLSGKQLLLPYEEGMRYFDLWNGRLLSPQRSGDAVSLSFPMAGRGFGALLVLRSRTADSSFDRWLAAMHVLAGKPLKSYSNSWRPLPQRIVPIPKTGSVTRSATRPAAQSIIRPATQPVARSATRSVAGMVLIPAAKQYRFESKGVMIEGDELSAANGIQHPWQSSPARSQQHVMEISSFYIDIYPVTNGEFKKFLDATHYHPADDHHFLKDWKGGVFPEGWDDKPVTWVSIEDARAYAAWAGKRLPHEWEWQYAAQGNDNRLYPWGNDKDSTRMPPSDTGRQIGPPGDVRAYPQGVSPFGVMDMVGNVWQWTDEYRDEHTRAAVLKGGSYYLPKGNYYSSQTFSGWYFPQAKELTQYGKYLLMSPGIDRSATVGFRCVKDL